MKVLWLSLFFLACFSWSTETVVLSQKARVSIGSFTSPQATGADIWGYTDALGRPYAIMTTATGTTVFDLSIATNPRVVGSISGLITGWRDVKTYIYNTDINNFSAYAFVTAEANQGLQIIDLSEAPQRISLAATYRGFASAHNIFIHPEAREPYAYVLGSNNRQGVTILDISNPRSPRITGNWNINYVHDFFTHYRWADPDWDNKDVGIAFAGQQGVVFLDLTDKSRPSEISRLFYEDLAYAHSGWVDESGRYLITFDELDEANTVQKTTVRVLDISDIENPQHVFTWTGPTGAIDHNGFVKGNQIYISNYTRGLTVLNLEQLPALSESANFDTYPPNDIPDFYGAWGAYPYYDNNLIAVSDINNGLYVLEAQVYTLEWQTEEEEITACAGSDVDFNVVFVSDLGNPLNVIADGLPQGSSFNQSTPIQPNTTGSLHLSIDADTPPGRYTITLRGTTADTNLEDRTIILTVRGPAQAAAPISPAEGESAFDFNHDGFQVDDQGPGLEHRVQISSEPSFANPAFEGMLSDSATSFPNFDGNGRRWYWRVVTTSVCGDQAVSETRSFFAGGDHILLVDDDDNTPDVRSYYVALLEEMGLDFQVYEVTGNNDPGPDADTAASYRGLLWFSGDRYSVDGEREAGPNETDEEQLNRYIAQGGKLVLSSQDYITDRGESLDGFPGEQLGIAAVDTQSPRYDQVFGAGSLADLGALNLQPDPSKQNFYDRYQAAPGFEKVLVTTEEDGAAVAGPNSLSIAFPLEDLIAGNSAAAAALVSPYLLPSGLADHDGELTYRRFLALDGSTTPHGNIILLQPGAQPAKIEIFAYQKSGLLGKRYYPHLKTGGSLRINRQALSATYNNPLWLSIASDQPILAFYEQIETGQAFAAPAQAELSRQRFIPHIAKDTISFTTNTTVVNGGTAANPTQLAVAGGNNLDLELNQSASGQVIDFEQLLGEDLQNNLGFAVLTTSLTQPGQGIAAMETFGFKSGDGIAGLSLAANTDQRLVFAHIAKVENQWWTGIAAANPNETAVETTIRAYSENGDLLLEQARTFSAGEKLIALIDPSNAAEALVSGGLPPQTAWLEIVADQGLIGYELFGDLNSRRFAGLENSTAGSGKRYLPEAGGGNRFAGIALINDHHEQQTVGFQLLAADGTSLGERTATLPGKSKLLTLAEQLFDDIPTGAYLELDSEFPIIAFQLYGDRTNNWLCGLNAEVLPE